MPERPYNVLAPLSSFDEFMHRYPQARLVHRARPAHRDHESQDHHGQDHRDHHVHRARQDRRVRARGRLAGRDPVGRHLSR